MKRSTIEHRLAKCFHRGGGSTRERGHDEELDRRRNACRRVARRYSRVRVGGARREIVFTSDRAGGGPDLYSINRDGSGEQRLTFGLFARAPQWSPSGDRIAFSVRGADGNWDVYTVAPDGSKFTRG